MNTTILERDLRHLELVRDLPSIRDFPRVATPPKGELDRTYLTRSICLDRWGHIVGHKEYDPNSPTHFRFVPAREGISETQVYMVYDEACGACLAEGVPPEEAIVMDSVMLDHYGIMPPGYPASRQAVDGNTLHLGNGATLRGSGWVQYWCIRCGRTTHVLIGK